MANVCILQHQLNNEASENDHPYELFPRLHSYIIFLSFNNKKKNFQWQVVNFDEPCIPKGTIEFNSLNKSGLAPIDILVLEAGVGEIKKQVKASLQQQKFISKLRCFSSRLIKQPTKQRQRRDQPLSI